MIRRGIFVLPRALVIGVQAEVNVEPSIAVVVGNGRAGERSLRRVRELERVRLLPKLAAAFIQKQQRAVGAHHDHVLAAVVVEIGEQRAGRVFQDPQAGGFGDVFERSVAAVAIEAIGQARRLANIEIVEAVVVDVGDRDAVVSVDVDAARAVEHRAPVVRAMQQLRRVGRIAAERGGSDVDIDRANWNGPAFRRALANCADETRRKKTAPMPNPSSHALFAIEAGARAHDFIANASLHAARKLGWSPRSRRSCGVDRSDLEFGSHDLGEDAERRTPTLEETLRG